MLDEGDRIGESPRLGRKPSVREGSSESSSCPKGASVAFVPGGGESLRPSEKEEGVDEEDQEFLTVPLWWKYLVGEFGRGGGRDPSVDGGDSAFEEDVSVDGGGRREWSPSSRRLSHLGEDDFSFSSSRKSSRESKNGEDEEEGGGRRDDESRDRKEDGCESPSTPRLGHSHQQLHPRFPVERRDSLLEAVLAAKKGGWNGLKRTESLESSASGASSDCCTCDDCFLDLSDASPRTPRVTRKKNSNWRKLRNVVQWTPFIQTYKRHKYPWVQLAGHQGNFKAGYKQGTIMKKLCQAEEKAFEEIMKDELRPFVPNYLGIVEGSEGEKYLQLQDLLSDFEAPCVMDIKMGVRTYLEEELAKARHKPKLRKDMFDKMIQIDSKAPTEAENRAKAVTKPRYMVWRETISSTATLGFRIEGIRRGDGTSSKDFKTTRTRDQVLTAISSFIEGYPKAVVNYIQRLKDIKLTLEKSSFFKSHELIGSSLLFVHNENKSNVWLIDFAKTVPLPDAVNITHKEPWVEGTHEDGYLIGLDNLIEIMDTLRKNPPQVSAKKDVRENHSDAKSNNGQINSTEDVSNISNNKESALIITSSSSDNREIDSTVKLNSSVKEESTLSKSSSKNCNVTDVVERKSLNSTGGEEKSN